MCADEDTLDRLELLRLGVWGDAPVGPDGPVSLAVPVDLADDAARAGALEVVDPEGMPLARVAVDRPPNGDGVVHAAGSPIWLGHRSSRPFERLYRHPADVRTAVTGGGAFPVVLDRPATTEDVEVIRSAREDRPVILLVLAGCGRWSAVTLLRSALALARELTAAEVVAVPLSQNAPEATRGQVLAAYGDGAVLHLLGTGTPVVDTGRDGDGELRTGAEVTRTGLVLFFTGLSGSGKSTLARAVRDVLLEEGDRVSLLDGDIVRRNLSRGLTFSPEDRETNIRRIGWVAAEIAHHGGTAICSPIAPYAATRAEVRDMVRDRGGDFVLVHVSTPLAECERRDRKGLYERARRGEIPDFTGISSPYEEPADADIHVDTTGRTIEAARDDVLDLLRRRGLLHPASTTSDCA
jgi:sulfate adenylyltransferase